MRFQCPNCREIIATDNQDMGTKVQCGSCMQVIDVPSTRFAPGVVLGDFLLLEELGKGGMGLVYLAHQISLDRPAAVKVLTSKFANNPTFITGFIKEARAAAQLNHPHIVQAFAVGDDEGTYYFAMEFVDGETMKAILKRETVVDVQFALNVVQQIAEALDYAWNEARLVHRDIKPDNIMITSNGRAKLADLGLARKAEDANEDNPDEVVGTPQYISPEQLTGVPVDARSDIYSLGATFYHFVTGRFPFLGDSAIEIAQKHLTDELDPPHVVAPNVPENVSLVICKMMQKNPDDRYQSAGELVEDLLMVRRGKLPPGIASMHGGGFAGKTLILVNKNQYTRGGIALQPRPKAKPTWLYLTLGGAGVLLLGVIAIIIAMQMPSSQDLAGRSSAVPFETRVEQLIQQIRTSPTPETHAACLKFMQENPTLSTPNELNKWDNLQTEFSVLDEAMLKLTDLKSDDNIRVRFHKQYSESLK